MKVKLVKLKNVCFTELNLQNSRTLSLKTLCYAVI
jgi:hypothetical protein